MPARTSGSEFRLPTRILTDATVFAAYGGMILTEGQKNRKQDDDLCMTRKKQGVTQHPHYAPIYISLCMFRYRALRSWGCKESFLMASVMEWYFI